MIISFDTASGRIENFYEKMNPAQVTLIIGNHIGELQNLVDNYLPKAAIDRIQERLVKTLEKRGDSRISKEDSPAVSIITTKSDSNE